MRKTLRDLAMKGFSSIPDEIDALTDKFSIFLNEKNIDGVVASNFIVPLLPELVWNGKQVSLLSFRSFHLLSRDSQPVRASSINTVYAVTNRGTIV
jgi:hypothetical protein